MTNKRYVKYGDRKMAIDDGLTLEQVKGIMARHFPELAEPEVKSETKGDETVYTFTKKAGKKGAGAHRQALRRLLALRPTPIVPAEVVRAVVRGGEVTGDPAAVLRQTAEHSARCRVALLALRPMAGPGGDLL